MMIKYIFYYNKPQKNTNAITVVQSISNFNKRLEFKTKQNLVTFKFA